DDLVLIITNSTSGGQSTITIEKAVSNSLQRIEEMHFFDKAILKGDWEAQIGYEVVNVNKVHLFRKSRLAA
ncbi:MAG: hypothetical protein GY951_12720, partial [Psychromonas sp.]|nr:hypothetical protein [Psychromonas sp.]